MSSQDVDRSANGTLHSQKEQLESDAAPLDGEPVSGGDLVIDRINKLEEDAVQNAQIQLARLVLHHCDPIKSIQKKQVADLVYANDLTVKDYPSSATDQGASGRCWMFASSNVLRYRICKKLNLKDLALSNTYTAFWDWLEKANFFLELMIKYKDEPLESRRVSHFVGNPISDGGRNSMYELIGDKYGAIPAHFFPEAHSSTSTHSIRFYLNSVLRQYAMAIRGSQSPRQLKDGMMEKIYQILTIAFGTPPRPDQSLTWEYRDKDDVYHKWVGTPLDFWKEHRPESNMSLVHDPRHALGTRHVSEDYGNVWGKPLTQYNVSKQDLKDAVKRMIDDGQPVNFGCDVDFQHDISRGLLHEDVFPVERAYGAYRNLADGASMTLADRLSNRDALLAHSMVIVAYGHGRFKVENSWGKHPRYIDMSEEWFDKYVYEVVVDKKLATDDQIKALEGQVIMLKPWDPMI